MKKLLSLILVVGMTIALIPSVAVAANYAIKGEALIFKPPVGTQSVLQYKLIDGSENVTEGVTWSVDEDAMGVSINQDTGELTITNGARGSFIITAGTLEGSAQIIVEISSKFLFYDFDMFPLADETGHIAPTIDNYNFRTGTNTPNASNRMEGVGVMEDEYTENLYVQGVDAPNLGQPYGGPSTILAFTSTPPNEPGVPEAFGAQMLTLEGKFKNHGTDSWGYDNRQWIFYLVFNSVNQKTWGGGLGAIDQAQTLRAIDIRTDEETNGYRLGNFHGVDGALLPECGHGGPKTPEDVEKIEKSIAIGAGKVCDFLEGERDWISARLTLDFENKTYSVWADDILLYENYALYDGAEALRTWSFSCAGDDIAIYSGAKSPEIPEIEFLENADGSVTATIQESHPGSGMLYVAAYEDSDSASYLTFLNIVREASNGTLSTTLTEEQINGKTIKAFYWKGLPNNITPIDKKVYINKR